MINKHLPHREVDRGSVEWEYCAASGRLPWVKNFCSGSNNTTLGVPMKILTPEKADSTGDRGSSIVIEDPGCLLETVPQ